MTRTTRRAVARLVSRATAAVELGISLRTFSRHWSDVFTDPRDPADRRERVARFVYADELETAIEHGGRINQRAKAAVLNHRDRCGRIDHDR